MDAFKIITILVRDKGNMKLAYIRNNGFIYTVGASITVQFQLLEALLEHVSFRFHEMYDVNVIMSYGDFNPAMFQGSQENPIASI